MDAVQRGITRLVSLLGMLISTITVGLIAGLSTLVLGTKAVLLVPALAVGFAMIVTPYSPLFAIVASVPINVEIAGPITVIRLVIVFGLFVAILQGIRGQAPKVHVPLPEGLIPLLLFAWIFFSTIAVSEGSLVSRLGGFFIYAVVIFAILIYVDTFDRFRKAMLTLVGVGLVQVVLVVAETQLGLVFLGGLQAELAEATEEEVRAVGASAHPIFLASFFQIVMVFAIFFISQAKTPVMRLIMVGALGLFVFAWVITWSRSSWIGMAAMVGLAMLLWTKETRFLGIIGGSVGFIILAAHDFSLSQVMQSIDTLSAVQQGSLRAGVSSSSESFSWRTENWQAAVSIWASHPIFGVGVDLVHTFMADHLPPGALGHRFVSAAIPHNMFLQVLSESGLPGLLLFVSLWVSAVVAVLRAWQIPILKPFAFAFLVALAGQFTTYMFNPIPREIWFTLGMALVLGRLARQYREGTLKLPSDQ